VPQDSFQEQARNPKFQQRRRGQMQQDLQEPIAAVQRHVKNTMIFHQPIAMFICERDEIEAKYLP